MESKENLCKISKVPEYFLCNTKKLLPSIKIENSKYNEDIILNSGTCNKILKIFQKNHDKSKMMFAVLKGKI